jgi:ribosomal protein S12
MSGRKNDTCVRLRTSTYACFCLHTRSLRRYAGSSAGADIASDLGMLLELLPAIKRKFGLSPEQIDEQDAKHKALIYAMIKKASADLVGKVITKQLVLAILKIVGVRMAAKQVLKYIPIAGQAADALSVVAMVYVENSHIVECYQIAKGAIGA